ncbi:amidohydrolase [Halodesulfovibrio marinisediminis]|uniref:5-methylthioadenosine/S-adenosylhomocysteine deaminase n=1 Tax=Halodesulfovibrio marinisediminis DSM 17456 TaxID=1121457 RepID=A0A1N6I5M1_9BACT|nr:amidohydrolase [Halodesulfovibrio marinisediminis]SIO27303.1 5-methylthioadenosine/S-adenosylhomocysteine deaminase [Halodesulfovibrio marinisediminis DSM 17456]
MQSCDTLLFAEIIVTQNESRSIIYNGGIAVSEGKIVCVDTADAVRSQYTSENTMELGNSLLMPGLINSHTHAAMTLLRGVADDLPLMDWLNDHIFPVEQNLTAEQVELGALLACAEMTRYGTTSFCDMYLIEDATYKAVDQSGLRVLGGEGLFVFPSPAYPDFETGIKLVREMEAKWRGNARIRQAVMPHAVYTTTPEILTTCREVAEELDLPLHIHLAETPAETKACLESFGKRPVEYAHSLGLLSERTTVAHAVDLTDDEISLLAETGTNVAHNPESNMKLASGMAPIQKMLAKGVNVTLGTDGAASNNALNMFTEMASCAFMHKVQLLDPTAATAQSVLDMATCNGARSMGQADLGSLVEGKQADIIAIDLTQPNLLPMHNPVSQLVYATNGAEVHMSMVAGEVLYQDGKYLKIDYPALIEAAKDVAKWVQKKIQKRS